MKQVEIINRLGNLTYLMGSGKVSRITLFLKNGVTKDVSLPGSLAAVKEIADMDSTEVLGYIYQYPPIKGKTPVWGGKRVIQEGSQTYELLGKGSYAEIVERLHNNP